VGQKEVGEAKASKCHYIQQKPTPIFVLVGIASKILLFVKKSDLIEMFFDWRVIYYNVHGFMVLVSIFPIIDT